MSIVRGVNRKQNHPPNQNSQIALNKPIGSHRALSKLQYQQITHQMKSLMRQNTRLKHENLQLKQQLMLAKIQFENLKLQNDDRIRSLEIKLTDKMGKNIEKINKTTKSDHQLRDFTIKLEKYPQNPQKEVKGFIENYDQFIKWASKQTTKPSHDATCFQAKYSQRQIHPKMRSKEVGVRERSLKQKSSRKQQIMSKYHNIMVDNSESQSELDYSITYRVKY